MALSNYKKATFSDVMSQGLHIQEEKPGETEQAKAEELTEESADEGAPAVKTEELTELKSGSPLINDIFHSKKKQKPKKSSRTFYIEDHLYEEFVAQATENGLSPSEALSMVLERVLA